MYGTEWKLVSIISVAFAAIGGLGAGVAAADITLGAGFEPVVAVNPGTLGNIAMARLSNARVSTDGGRTWSAEAIATAPAGYGPWPGSDPPMPIGRNASLVFDSQGRLFWSYAAHHVAGGGSDIFVCELDPQKGTVIAGPFPITTSGMNGRSNESAWLTADKNPRSRWTDRLYVVWTRFENGTAIRTKYSTDHGRTWTGQRRLSELNQLSISPSHITVVPNGRVYAVYVSQTFDGCNTTGVSGEVFLYRSINGGESYSAMTQPFARGRADVTQNIQTCSGTIPGAEFRAGTGRPYILPDPSRVGTLYVVCGDDPDNVFGSGDAADVFVVLTTNSGESWSTPLRINDGPETSFQLFQTAAIDPVTGTIAVAWYDNRAGRRNAAGNFLLDFRYAVSHDGAHTFSPSMRFNDAPFDPDEGLPFERYPGPPRTTWIGDYFGLALHGGDLYAMWTGNGEAGEPQQTIFDRAPAALRRPGRTELRAVEVASGFSRSLYAGSPRGDAQRLFVVEQRSGMIKIIRLTDGAVIERPFLDIGDLIYQDGGERGLLGLAFHPEYADNGFFFVHYNDPSGTSVIARYRRLEDDPDRADHDSAKIILTQEQQASIHNGGMIAFGPSDGFLYVGFGDDARGSNAQSGATWLGKMLRIDVNVDPEPYLVPVSNPYVGDPNTLDEIWARGLRNPWRWSFDRDTGDMYIGDVGETTREEVNFQAAESAGGENYGWPCMEGFFCHGGGCDCDDPALTLPVVDYVRTENRLVIGGYVYRGQAIRDLRGTYFHAGSFGRIRSLRMIDGEPTEFEDRTFEFRRTGPGFGTVSFGEDGAGEMYMVTLGGTVYKIVPDGLALGDMNGDGVVNAFDIDAFLLALLDRDQYFARFPEIDPDVTGDINGDEVLNAFDIQPFVELLFN